MKISKKDREVLERIEFITLIEVDDDDIQTILYNAIQECLEGEDQ